VYGGMFVLSNSKLGFGLMRLPKDESGNIDLQTVSKMVDKFIDSGFTYFDTAYIYEGSEEITRKALVNRYDRNLFTLANKLPGWLLNKQEDVERIFNESLERCGVDYFDYYLIHSVEESNYDIYQKYNCFEFVTEMKKQGKVKHMGFSFHGSSNLLKRVLKDHPEVEFVQLQINYLDWEDGLIESRTNYEIAREHNKPIIVMEPVKGGTLASFPKEVEKMFKDYNPNKSIASWALRYVASLDGIMTILSGMSNEEQIDDNINTFKNLVLLNNEEKEIIEKVKYELNAYPIINCTSCRYCIDGCPKSILIPDLFKAYNGELTYGKSPIYKDYYDEHVKDGHGKASDCIECGTCQDVCPQHLSIIEYLKDVSKVFDK
jgi:predicted aldo/keto reductase-like oxidoreductase